MWQKAKNKTLASGLLIKNLPVFDSLELKESFLTYQYSIIVTHACDIESYCKCVQTKEQETQSRQIITQIIFCPAFDEEQFKQGSHLKSQYNYQFNVLPIRELDKYKGLHNIRYHYLKSNLDRIPSFFIDFKHYFSLPAKLIKDIVADTKEDLYKLNHWQYTCLIDRFAHYLQRVAVPSSQGLLEAESPEEKEY